jgi:hypothetical protein
VIGLDHPAIEAQVNRGTKSVFDLQHQDEATLGHLKPTGQTGQKPDPGRDRDQGLVFFDHTDQQPTFHVTDCAQKM